MTVTEFILRIVVASFAGAIVGLERQWSNKSAGLRTNTLVALGASIFVLLSTLTTAESGDPSRVLGQVVTGIGFLGAGVIFRQGFNVQGLTTAATLWCSAAIGALAGFGYFIFAIICSILVITINLSFIFSDRWISRKNNKKKINNKNNEVYSE